MILHYQIMTYDLSNIHTDNGRLFMLAYVAIFVVCRSLNLGLMKSRKRVINGIGVRVILWTVYVVIIIVIFIVFIIIFIISLTSHPSISIFELTNCAI